MKITRNRLIYVFLGLIIAGFLLGLIAPKYYRYSSKSSYDNASEFTYGGALKTMSKPEAPSAQAADESGSSESFSYIAGTAHAAEIERKIIKNGSLTLEVKDVKQASREAEEAVKPFGGNVYATNISKVSYNTFRAEMVIKVPVENFPRAMSALKEISVEVLNESTAAEDVTGRYVDLQARIKNKRSEEEAFLRILNRAGNMKDTLAVTREVSRVRGEIEQIQGQLKLLEFQTALSTINLVLMQVEPERTAAPPPKWKPLREIKRALGYLKRDLREFADVVIVVVFRVMPNLLAWLFALIVAVLPPWYLIRWIWRKFKATKAAENPDPSAVDVPEAESGDDYDGDDTGGDKVQ